MFTGPNIVRDGLVLALDAANEDSFRGEPTENLVPSGQRTCSSNFTRKGYHVEVWSYALVTDVFGRADATKISITPTGINSQPYADWGFTAHKSGGSQVGDVYTVSFDYKVTKNTTVPSLAVVYANGYKSPTSAAAASLSNETHTPLGDGWTRFSETATITTAGNTWWRFGMSSNNNETEVYVDNFQIELKSSRTRFVDGTRGTTVATGGGWKDMSGRGNHGQILNGTSTSNRETPLEGLDFDGADDRVTIPAFTYTPYCIDFWLYNNSLVPNTNGAIGGPSTYQTLISFGGGTAGVNLGGWTSGATNEALHIWSTSGGNRLTYTRDESIPVGYHNWIFNWNGSQYDIWVDGEKLNTYAGGGGHASLITYTNQPLYLGTDASTYEFYGKIFKFKMYQSQLSDRQVLNNFNAHRSKYGL